MNGPRQKFGDWEMIRQLGKGSYGVVALWRNSKTEQQVAVKKCPLLRDDPEEKQYKMKERWENELKIMQGEMKNEYIVSGVIVEERFLEALNNPKHSILPPLVMEYCDGGDLRTLLYHIKNSNGLCETEVKNVLKTLCSAIGYLHDHDITHRDLKPENIVIKNGRDGHIFKVTDFGYAKDIIDTNLNSQVGTVGYFAPEIILSGKYSPTVDFWSMGIVTFEVICGINPFVPHQTVKTWVEQVKGKFHDTIAITESKDNDFVQHNRIFDENRISSIFRGMIEKWLRIALEFNSKRGRKPEISGPPNEVRSGFFRHLETILNKKVLTIFCLTTYSFLSYEVTENTSMLELLEEIERDTNIPKDDIYLILTPAHIITTIQRNTKPVDLIIDISDGAMIYMSRIRNPFLNTDNIQMQPPKAIADACCSTNQTLQSFYVLELARKILFLARNENRHYAEFLKGFKTYAMVLNHHISTFEQDKCKIDDQSICGALENYLCMLRHSKQQLEEKKMQLDQLSTWNMKEYKLQHEVSELIKACTRIRHRHASVLRRSKELMDHEFLQDLDKDFFDVEGKEKLYASLRDKRIHPFQKFGSDKTKSLVNVYYDILERRKELLRDSRIHQVQEKLSAICEEFCKIRSITADAHLQISKYTEEIDRLTCEHLDEMWKIVEESAAAECKKLHENIPDLDSMMSSLELDQIKNGAANRNFQLDLNQSSSVTHMDVSSLIEECDTSSMVRESACLVQSLQCLRNSFNPNPGSSQ